MAKALKPLIIIQLLISIGALVLGVMLFQQREILKGRTQMLEKTAADVASALHYDEFKVANILDYATMGPHLKKLVGISQNRWTELQDTILDLANTKQDLEQTRDDLAQTRNELTDAKEQIVQLSDDLSQREAELADANSRIESLETEMASVKAELEGLTEEYASLEEELTDRNAEYESLKADFDKLVAETTGQGSNAAKGLAGRVLLVNPDWNFVVIDVGSEQGLAPASEMLVHRSDKLVGRVRISTIEDQIAVAEILGDWQQKVIRKGDFVISPES